MVEMMMFALMRMRRRDIISDLDYFQCPDDLKAKYLTEDVFSMVSNEGWLRAKLVKYDTQ